MSGEQTTKTAVILVVGATASYYYGPLQLQ